MTDLHGLIHRMADELDRLEQMQQDDRSAAHPLAFSARAYLAAKPQGEGPALPPGYIDPEHTGEDRQLLETFYTACQSEGGTADEIHLRGLRAVLARWGHPAHHHHHGDD